VGRGYPERVETNEMGIDERVLRSVKPRVDIKMKPEPHLSQYSVGTSLTL